MDHNTLLSVINFIYKGKIELKSSDEDEDFLSAMRLLNIRLGEEINAVVFEGGTSAATNRVKSKAPLHYQVIREQKLKYFSTYFDFNFVILLIINMSLAAHHFKALVLSTFYPPSR